MPPKKPVKKKGKEKKTETIALILAGYNKVSNRARKKMIKEIGEVYEGDEIYVGQNKFLYELAGKPIIKYVLDAVYAAKKKGKKLYDRIYIYNDAESFNKEIDVSRYPNLTVKQMKESVAAHWKDFYFNHIEYGQKVDVFFGDTPRITAKDVEYIHGKYSAILGKAKDMRGKLIYLVYGVVNFNDLKDTWLTQRLKYIKMGQNKGKLRSFVSFEGSQIRLGNTGAFLKDKALDPLIESEATNLLYNVRKILTPTALSKVMYYLWKLKYMNMIMQIKRRSINLQDFYTCIFDVISKLFKIDLSRCGGIMFQIKKNASRWENDIDGPKDFEIFQKKFRELKKFRGTSGSK